MVNLLLRYLIPHVKVNLKVKFPLQIFEFKWTKLARCWRPPCGLLGQMAYISRHYIMLPFRDRKIFREFQCIGLRLLNKTPPPIPLKSAGTPSMKRWRKSKAQSATGGRIAAHLSNLHQHPAQRAADESPRFRSVSTTMFSPVRNA